MMQAQHDQAYGVFKPVGCVVAAFSPDTDLVAVEAALADAGIAADGVSRLSAAQTIAPTARA